MGISIKEGRKRSELRAILILGLMVLSCLPAWAGTGKSSSLATLEVHVPADTIIREIVPVCFGDSLFFRGEWYQPGEYEIRITGGMEDTTFQLVVEERPDIMATVVTTPTCPGDSTGTATVRPVVSGTLLLTNWSGGMEINDSTAVGFKPGTYGVIVIDELNCSKRFTFTIDTFMPEPYSVEITSDSCASDGDFRVELTGNVTGELDGPSGPITAKVFDGLSAGDYTLSVFDDNGCYARDTAFTLEPFPSFTFDIQDSVTIKPGEVTMVPIIGDVQDISSIQWSPSAGLLCNDCNFLEASPASTTTYVAQITDRNGCPHTLTVTVVVDGFVNVYVPNIFSPNGDNINDFFKVFSTVENLEIIEFQIYSRWGEFLYGEEQTSPKDMLGWNGRFNGEDMNPGVYVWRVIYEVGGRQTMLSGSVTLNR
jgi:gliding motility-associated-like protein